MAAGGLTTHDLTVNVTPRGKVRVTLLKDMSDFSSSRLSVPSSEHPPSRVIAMHVAVASRMSLKTTDGKLPCSGVLAL